MRYNSSDVVCIGGYMVKLWSPYCLHLYVFCGFNWMGILNIHKVLKVAHRRFIFWSLKRVKAYLYFRMYFCYEIFIVFSFSYLCLVRVLFLDKKITASGIWFLHFSYSIFYIIFCQHSLNNDYSWHWHSVIVIGLGQFDKMWSLPWFITNRVSY